MHLSVFSSLCFGTLVALGSPIVHRRDTDLSSTGCDDYCAGTRPGNTKDDEVYVCKDWRLGPVAPPSGVPVDDIVGKYYRRFGGLCPGEFLKAWTNQTDGRWAYPPEQGFSIDTTGSPICSNLTLGKGDLIDRFGDETGDFVAPAFTPYAMRSIPPSNLNTRDAEYPYGYHVYMVADKITVLAGPTSPHFAQEGGGLQYRLYSSVAELVSGGYLLRMDPKSLVKILAGEK